MCDICIRHLALDMAIKSGVGENASDIVEAAKAYETYLNGPENDREDETINEKPFDPTRSMQDMMDGIFGPGVVCVKMTETGNE